MPAEDARRHPREDTVRHPLHARVRLLGGESEYAEKRVLERDVRLAREGALEVGGGQIEQADPRGASPEPGVRPGRARPGLRQALHEERHRPGLVRDVGTPRRGVLRPDDGARAVGVEPELVVHVVGQRQESVPSRLEEGLRRFRHLRAARADDEHVVPREKLRAALLEASAERVRRERGDLLLQPVGLGERTVGLDQLLLAQARRVPGTSVEDALPTNELGIARVHRHPLHRRAKALVPLQRLAVRALPVAEIARHRVGIGGQQLFEVVS